MHRWRIVRRNRPRVRRARRGSTRMRRRSTRGSAPICVCRASSGIPRGACMTGWSPNMGSRARIRWSNGMSSGGVRNVATRGTGSWSWNGGPARCRSISARPGPRLPAARSRCTAWWPRSRIRTCGMWPRCPGRTRNACARGCWRSSSISAWCRRCWCSTTRRARRTVSRGTRSVWSGCSSCSASIIAWRRGSAIRAAAGRRAAWRTRSGSCAATSWSRSPARRGIGS